MWIFLGVGAIIAAIFNVIWTIRKKDAQWFRFISLSLTALTVCSIYGMADRWVACEDWSAMLDVVPAMSRALWVLTVASVLINSVSLFCRNGEKK